MLIALRRRHMTWGPRKLLGYLERRYEGVTWPAASTIGELLRRHGMSVGRVRRHRTPAYTQPFGGCQQPNGVWCADFKGWFRTGDRTCCYPLTMTDAFSRYLLRCQSMERAYAAPTKTIFESAFREYGLPLAIRTDNGAPFASKAVGGLSRLAVWWLRLGIVPERIEPGQPQQNGRHERMHRTLKQETAKPPGPNMAGQQRRFDEFKKVYNCASYCLTSLCACYIKSKLSRRSFCGGGTFAPRLLNDLVNGRALKVASVEYPRAVGQRMLKRYFAAFGS
jgi:transposase InsO family protein